MPSSVRIHLASQPVDMRKSFDGRSMLARQVPREDPLSGHLFVFFNRTRDRVKVLWWHSGGFCLFSKRLEKGSFRLPRAPRDKESRKKERKGRRPLPSYLPREQRVHQPPPEALRCQACGREKTRCGEEKSEMLEWVPGHFKVIEEVRPKYACRPCDDGLVSKYKDHLRLHRLSGMYARQGVQLRTSGRLHHNPLK